MCTTSLTTTSFRRSASKTAFPTTSSRITSSFRRTFLWFSFLFSIFFSTSFRGQEIEKEDELLQTVLEQELAELLANKPCPLGSFHDHLGQENLWQIQLQQNNLEKNKQLSAPVPDRELSQLHLHQLCLQDPASAISRQLPEESLSSSFSKKELSEQDLSNISLDKFFPENFENQLSEQQLQQNLSTDQRQLQENKLTQNNFQQLSLEQPSFTEKTLNKELATTFAKKSLIDNLVFQNFFFATLALQKTASGQLGENNLYKKQLEQSSFTQTEEEACKEQLLTTGFPAASLNQQPFSNSLVQQSGAKAASRPELLQRELPEEELADKNFDKNSLAATSLHTRTSARQLQKEQLEEENFRGTERPALRHFALAAFQEQLAKKHFYQNSFYNSSFPAETSNRTAFQPAA